MNRSGGEGKGALAVLLAGAILSAASAAEERIPGEEVAAACPRVLALLDSMSPQAPVEAVAQQLAQLGPGALPILVAIWADQPLPGADQLPGPRPEESPLQYQRRRETTLEACRRALDRLEGQLLYEYLRERAGAGASLGQQVALVQLLGEIGNASAVPTLVGIMNGIPELGLRCEVHASCCRRALQQLLRREGGGAYDQVQRAFSSLATAARRVVVEAAGEIGTEADTDLLGNLLGAHEDLDLTILEQLVKVGQRPGFPRSITEKIRDQLGSPRASVRRLAAQALGRMRVAEAVGGLIAALDDADEIVVREAHQALFLLFGVMRPPERGAWRAVWEEEEGWQEQRCPQLLIALRSADAGEQIEALTELSRHRLHADALTDPIGELLSGTVAPIRQAACSALGRLGSPRAIPHLERAAEDETAAVRSSAVQALLQLGVRG